MSTEVDDTTGYGALAARLPDGACTLDVNVTGAHCGACIQKIESRLTREQGVRTARLNFSTHRLHIEWQGTPDQAGSFVKMVQDLGYRVSPANQNGGTDILKEEKALLLYLVVAGFASGNIMLLSLGLWITTADSMGHAMRDFMHWISAAISIPASLYAGIPFFSSAARVLRRGHTNMDVPISVGVFLTLGISLFQTLQHAEHAYFDSVIMLLFFLLIGRYLDMRARRQARSAATDLLSSLSGFATVLTDAGNQILPIRDLREGMRVRVSMGEKFPTDAIVAEGIGSVDESLVTGETVPRAIAAGASVYAGTLNIGAPMIIEVTKPAEKSLLSDIVRLMDRAAQSQSRYVRLADRAARLYTPVVHTLALVAFLFWLFVLGAPWQQALIVAATVLIITCPCALGLAVPVVHVLTSGVLFRRKVLLKSGDAIERLAAIDTVLLDKTGTLTYGQPTLDGTPDPDDLRLAASLSAHSRHPFSLALSRAYQGPLEPLEDIQEQAGQGLSARWNGQDVRLGSATFCGPSSGPMPGGENSEIWLNVAGTPRARFTFTDQVRADTPATLHRLQAQGLTLELISGDNQSVVDRVARDLPLTRATGNLTPPQKYARLEEYRAQGHRTLMIGDGLNDAPVLAGADVSMAPGSAIDMAQNAADIVFMGDRFAAVADTYATAVFAQRLVRQNFALAIIYNMLAIPLAMAGMVTPLIAAAAMSGSSLVVIANSFRIRWQVKS